MTRETAKGSIQFILIIVFLLVIYLLNFALELMKTEPKIQNKANNIPIVRAETILATAKKISFTDTAQITARSYVPITPEVTGRIVSVASEFKTGLCFDKNQILFTIDKHEIQAQYDTAFAESEQARANLALVQAEADAAIAEWKILNPNLTIPPLVAKQPQIKQANASLETAQAKLKLASIDLKHAQFSYPFSGCVESSQVEIGQFATRGQSLGQVFSKDSLEIIVNLSSEKAEKLKNTLYNADIIVDGIHYNAKIDRISDVIDSQTQFSKVILKPETVNKLQPNKIGMVTFSTVELKKVFAVHDTDIINDTQICLLSDDNKIVRQSIDIIERTDTEIYINAFDTEIKIVRGCDATLKNNMQVDVTKE